MKTALALISPAFIRLSADEIRIIDILHAKEAAHQEKRAFLNSPGNMDEKLTYDWETLKRRAENLDLEAANELRSYNSSYHHYRDHQFLKAKADLWEWLQSATKEVFALLSPVGQKWQGHAEKVLADYVESQSAARAMYAKTAALVGINSPATVDPIEEKLGNFIQLCRVLQTERPPLKGELEFINLFALINPWIVEL